MKIFIGDLVHKWDKKGVWTFPLNIALIKAYAKKKLSEKNIPIEIQLFKDPVNIIEKIKNDKPDIVALAYYVWNSELNRKIFEITKKYNKDCLTLGGGPNITSINANEKGARKFFDKQKNNQCSKIGPSKSCFIVPPLKKKQTKSNSYRIKQNLPFRFCS